MGNNIVVVGSSNTDMIVRASRIPKAGETILGGAFSSAAGGKGANQAVAAARAGGKVTFIARIGNDDLGKQSLKCFEQDSLNLEYIQKDETVPSGVALIMVDEDGANSIAVASGANANLTPQHIREAQYAIEDADILLMQLETPLETVVEAAKIAASARVKAILNPAPAQPLPDQLMKHIAIITPNESESQLLTGVSVFDENSAKQAAERLHEKGIETVVITLGAKGSYLSINSVRQIIPGFTVNVVDTTAAGDTFNGAFAVALAEGLPAEQAVRFANAAGALSVTREGAQPSIPYRKDIDTLWQ